MDTRFALGGIALVLSIAGSSNGLTIHLQDTAPNQLPHYSLIAGGNSPLEIVFELQNEQIADSPPVVLWQLGLNINGDVDSMGDVLIQSVSAPDNSMFGADPGPTAEAELPATEATLSDADASAEFAGVAIPAQSAVPVVQLSLLASSAASGDFTLTCDPFDPDDIDGSSYWINADEFESMPFDNPLSSSQQIELAVIHVMTQQLPGDFNHDLSVNAADYTVWRNGLNSVYELDDYEIWKSYYGQTVSMNATAIAVPEPHSLVLIGLICPFVGKRGRRRIHASDHKLPPSFSLAGLRGGAILSDGSPQPGHHRPKSTRRFR
jgi:hypothetical protein